MRPRLVPHAAAEQLTAGLVLAQDLRGASGRVALAKGHVLAPADLPALATLPWDELHLVEMEPGDLHEGPAGHRLAAAAAGPGVEVQPLSGGAWPLVARHRGVLEIDAARLARVNELPDVVIYTQPHQQIVLEGELLGRAKIVPFVTRESGIAAAEQLCSEAGGSDGVSAGLVRVRPFLPMRVAAIVTESLDDEKLARFRRAFEEKLAFFGSTLSAVHVVPGAPALLAAALNASLRSGVDLVAVAGTRPMDPLDPALRALEGIGAELDAYGAPVHPGTLLWLAHAGRTPIIGMPSCGLFSKATVFDLLLPRMLAGEPIGRAQIAALGCGGLLTRDMSYRFPPYSHTRERGELDAE